jgi:transposase
MAGPHAKRVKLPRKLRKRLQRWARSLKQPHRRVMRAKIALLAEEGRSNADIAREVGCDVKTARKWRERIAELPDLLALEDDPRTGRPARIPIEAHYELIKIACARADGDKAPFQQLWTLKTLADALAKQTGVRMSRTEVWRILQGADLKPHRVRMWLHSPDPDFRPKVARICKLYLKPPAGATVVCVDEKPGMQAIEERFPLRPCAPGRAARKEFEYRRCGTRTLIAGLNVRTGKVFAHCGPTRTAKDLLAYMEQLAEHYPTGPLYIIWDNLNIHRGPRWKAFNARHGGRLHFVYTPIHASWVNQIEVWFSILARRVLKHASFPSTRELTARVLAFVKYWNDVEAHPFRWKFRGRWRSVLPPLAA